MKANNLPFDVVIPTKILDSPHFFRKFGFVPVFLIAKGFFMVCVSSFEFVVCDSLILLFPVVCKGRAYRRFVQYVLCLAFPIQWAVSPIFTPLAIAPASLKLLVVPKNLLIVGVDDRTYVTHATVAYLQC